ncbi:MAG: FAD-binding oxidoreductase [Chitinophagaceae bacterium]|nr:MAG: FAD-binding oxidoreductase [Chitinophagaceae bacterium]
MEMELVASKIRRPAQTPTLKYLYKMFSIWEQETVLAPVDVAIAGGGFAGFWTAFHLRRRYPKARIALLEKELLPMGASTRNAGFACFGSLGELVADEAELGTEGMQRLVEIRYKGLRQIEKWFEPKCIDLDWCGGYELFPPGSVSKEKLEHDLDHINSTLKDITGKRRSFRNATGRIHRFRFGGTEHMVFNRLEGALHSGKLAALLLRTLQATGVQWMPGVAVTGFVEKNDTVEIQTAAGFQLNARNLVVANNTAAASLLPGISVTPARGQVLLTSPINDLRWSGTFHADEGYYYFRNLGNRVLLGGARNKAFDAERTDERVTTSLIQDELERFLDEVVLPGKKNTYSIEHRWSGIMGMGEEKGPVVRAVRPNVFAAVALGGIGVAVAPEAGKRISKMIQL